jgi:hypothetical protein
MKRVTGGMLLVAVVIMGSALLSVVSAEQQAVGLFVTSQGDLAPNGDQGIYISDMQTQSIKKIYDGSVNYAHFSPDGRYIAFTGNNKLNIINNDGTGLQPNLAACSEGTLIGLPMASSGLVPIRKFIAINRQPTQ